MEIPYDLLIKYSRKQTSPDENRLVEEWLLKEDNLSLFLDLKKEWRYLQDDPVNIPDKNLVWQKIRTGVGFREKPETRRLNVFRLVAAVIFLVAATTVLNFLIFDMRSDKADLAEQFTTISTRSNEKSRVELSDGTSVWLNSHSLISFSNRYDTDKREISINGELFLDVTPSAKKFIIHTGRLNIEVMGTSFNVRTSGENVEISLVEGKVAVIDSLNGKQLFVMAPSQHAVIHKSTLEHQIQSANTSLDKIWTEENLSMYNESLDMIVEKLEVWYGVRISYIGLDPSKRYTFYLQDETLQEFMNLFSSLTPINYTLSGDSLFIETKTE